MYVCMYTLNVVANLCKEGNILINDSLNTFYLRLSGVIHNMLKDHSDSKTRCPLYACGITILIMFIYLFIYLKMQLNTI